MIEVSIAHDKSLNSLSDFAQLLYLKILPHTDDWGRFEGDPEIVKARVDPLSKKPEAKYNVAMQEIARAKLWLWYKTDKGKVVIQYNEDSFERINAFLIKSRKNYEYPPYKDSYELICGDMGSITHRETKAESNKQKVESKKQKEFVAPEMGEVIAFFLSNGYPAAVGEKAFNYYNEADWHDGAGKKLRNWKQKMIAVWFKEENRNGTHQSSPSKAGRRQSPTVESVQRVIEATTRRINARDSPDSDEAGT